MLVRCTSNALNESGNLGCAGSRLWCFQGGGDRFFQGTVVEGVVAGSSGGVEDAAGFEQAGVLVVGDRFVPN